MSRTTIVVFLAGILLLIYGYLCRLLSIYFFWDSKYIGWFSIICASLLLLIDIRMARKRRNQNIFFVRIFVAALIIILALEASAVFWVKTNNSYRQVSELIEKDPALKNELGDIRGFGGIPGISITDILKFPTSESLTFMITIRGTKVYKEMEVTIARTTLTSWSVISTQVLW
jgi:hypothetical protein